MKVDYQKTFIYKLCCRDPTISQIYIGHSTNFKQRNRGHKNSKPKKFLLHRLKYEAHYGSIPEGMCIDHIDNNPQNNNIENLRLATLSQNQMNKITRKDKLSGYKCIYKTKWNTFYVRIHKNNKVVYQKTFKTLEEAIINRNIQLKLHHGEYVNLG